MKNQPPMYTSHLCLGYDNFKNILDEIKTLIYLYVQKTIQHACFPLSNKVLNYVIYLSTLDKNHKLRILKLN